MMVANATCQVRWIFHYSVELFGGCAAKLRQEKKTINSTEPNGCATYQSEP